MDRNSVQVLILLTLISFINTAPLDHSSEGKSPSDVHREQKRSIASPCQSLSYVSLVIKLNSIGGYNKRYVATTAQEAKKNFPNLLNATAQISNVTSNASTVHPNVTRTTPSTTPTPSTTQPNSYGATRMISVARRGTKDEFGFHRLCTEWAAVTTLSPDFFPRYINEVICDSKDFHCLSGEGFCLQKTFIVSILRRTGRCTAQGQEEWVEHSQPIRSCCECKVFPGSAYVGIL